MTKNEEIELANNINRWFNETINKDVHFWQRNPVAAALKENLTRISRWKNAKRGNAKKGWKVYNENKANRYGF